MRYGIFPFSPYPLTKHKHKQGVPHKCEKRYILAVSPDYQGKKIAQNLIRICLDNGITQGFTYAVTEAVNSNSQHVFRKLDFQPCHQVLYKEFVYQDIPIFARIKGHEGAILMDKLLT